MMDDELKTFLEEFTDPSPLPLRHRLLYTLQFEVLPQAVFQNHPELLRDLEEPGKRVNLLHFRSKTLVRCEVGTGSVDKMMDGMDAFGELKIETHRQNGHSLYLIVMPEPSPPCAHFVAIVYRDDEPRSFGQTSPSTRYFTLENGLGDKVFLCECKHDLSHRNLCKLPLDRKAFVDAIFQRLLGGESQPSKIAFL